jgi:NAD(P)-dependent dehydrogenase (short-subunit alcohol dehydrogenase family)
MKPENRTFVVSGGCSGLGLATARDLHAGGAYVSLLDLNEEAGAEIVRELGERAVFFECDVSSTESVERAVNGTAEWIKKTGKHLGGVVAAAGVGSAQKVWKCHIIGDADTWQDGEMKGSRFLFVFCHCYRLSMGGPASPSRSKRSILSSTSTSAARST